MSKYLVVVLTVEGQPKIEVLFTEWAEIDAQIKAKYGTQKDGTPHRWRGAVVNEKKE